MVANANVSDMDEPFVKCHESIMNQERRMEVLEEHDSHKEECKELKMDARTILMELTRATVAKSLRKMGVQMLEHAPDMLEKLRVQDTRTGYTYDELEVAFQWMVDTYQQNNSGRCTRPFEQPTWPPKRRSQAWPPKRFTRYRFVKLPPPLPPLPPTYRRDKYMTVECFNNCVDCMWGETDSPLHVNLVKHYDLAYYATLIIHVCEDRIAAGMTVDEAYVMVAIGAMRGIHEDLDAHGGMKTLCEEMVKASKSEDMYQLTG
jgi:hypothetical protein